MDSIRIPVDQLFGLRNLALEISNEARDDNTRETFDRLATVIEASVGDLESDVKTVVLDNVSEVGLSLDEARQIRKKAIELKLWDTFLAKFSSSIFNTRALNIQASRFGPPGTVQRAVNRIDPPRVFGSYFQGIKPHLTTAIERSEREGDREMLRQLREYRAVNDNRIDSMGPNGSGGYNLNENEIHMGKAIYRLARGQIYEYSASEKIPEQIEQLDAIFPKELRGSDNDFARDYVDTSSLPELIKKAYTMKQDGTPIQKKIGERIYDRLNILKERAENLRRRGYHPHHTALTLENWEDLRVLGLWEAKRIQDIFNNPRNRQEKISQLAALFPNSIGVELESIHGADKAIQPKGLIIGERPNSEKSGEDVETRSLYRLLADAKKMQRESERDSIKSHLQIIIQMLERKLQPYESLGGRTPDKIHLDRIELARLQALCAFKIAEIARSANGNFADELRRVLALFPKSVRSVYPESSPSAPTREDSVVIGSDVEIGDGVQIGEGVSAQEAKAREHYYIPSWEAPLGPDGGSFEKIDPVIRDIDNQEIYVKGRALFNQVNEQRTLENRAKAYDVFLTALAGHVSGPVDLIERKKVISQTLAEGRLEGLGIVDTMLFNFLRDMPEVLKAELPTFHRGMLERLDPRREEPKDRERKVDARAKK